MVGVPVWYCMSIKIYGKGRVDIFCKILGHVALIICRELFINGVIYVRCFTVTSRAVAPRVRCRQKSEKQKRKKERKKEGRKPISSTRRVLEYCARVYTVSYSDSILVYHAALISGTAQLQVIYSLSFSPATGLGLRDLHFTDARDTHPMVPAKLQIASHPRPIDKPIAHTFSKSAVPPSLHALYIHRYRTRVYIYIVVNAVKYLIGRKYPNTAPPVWNGRSDRHRFLALQYSSAFSESLC